MKKAVRFLSLLLVLMLLTALCGCGSSAKYSVASDTAYAEAQAPAEAWDEESGAGLSSMNTSGTDNGADSTGSATAIQTEKIVYSADCSMETTEFDTTVDGIYALVEELGGFMESTSVSGSDYYTTVRGYSSRSASFTIRVPGKSFNTLTSSLSDLGYVSRCSTYSENITRQYYDTEARLNAYKTQETRLLEMLSIAETVDDMLAIQQQLTEVQYEIDALTSTLANYDNDVSYSTVSLSVTEVQEYEPEPIETLTFGQKLARGFTDSCKAVGKFLVSFVIWLVSALPVLAVLAVVGAVVLLIVRRTRGSREKQKARREARKIRRQQKKAGNKTAPDDKKEEQ